ncbi:DMT family transporter [Candidatus Gottesmanbacteria bacterium]|nr:DMT family transporter [Candidatus Gottesmanbacteria bacterium]
MKNRQKALFAILLSGILGGGNAVFNKLGLKEIPSFLFIFLRFLITAIMLWPFFSKKLLKLNSNLRNLFLISVLPVINIILFAYGVQRTSANIATIIYTSTPITVAILSGIILKETFKAKRIAGVIFGFFGTGLIILLPIFEKKAALQSDLLGNSAIFLGMIFFSFYNVLSKKFHDQYSPVFITFIFAVTAMLMTFLFAGKDLMSPAIWQKVTFSGWIGLLYVGVFGSIALYLLFQYAVKYGTPLIGSMNSYLQPISGVIWAALILGEKVTPIFIVGSLITIVGVYLVTAKPDENKTV